MGFWQLRSVHSDWPTRFLGGWLASRWLWGCRAASLLSLAVGVHSFCVLLEWWIGFEGCRSFLQLHKVLVRAVASASEVPAGAAGLSVAGAHKNNTVASKKLTVPLGLEPQVALLLFHDSKPKPQRLQVFNVLLPKHCIHGIYSLLRNGAWVSKTHEVEALRARFSEDAAARALFCGFH